VLVPRGVVALRGFIQVAVVGAQHARLAVEVQDVVDFHLAEYPRLDDQEARFPDSVRTHAVTYKLFDVTSPGDMQEYSQIFISNARRGRFVFDGPEQVQWDLANSRCFILLRVEERKFLALTTADSDPNDPD